MARKMSDEEWRAFVSEGTRTGKLATTRSDGRPHVAPIWFVLDGDDVMFTTWATTVKGRSITADPRVALCVDDDRPPFSFVILEGRVTTSEDQDERLEWATAIAARYMGPDLADEYGARNAVPGELLVRFHPDKVLAEAELAE
jgi:PPOX class probable F420-dependent enzyme